MRPPFKIAVSQHPTRAVAKFRFKVVTINIIKHRNHEVNLCKSF